MSFEQPVMLWGLFGLIPVILVLLRAYTLGLRDLRRIMPIEDRRGMEKLLLIKWSISSAASVLMFAALVVAISEPVWGTEEIDNDRENIDLSVAFDISRSMYATDIEPSRLEAARDALIAIVDSVPDLRIAVTVFRGGATQVLPMTSDTIAFDYIASSLSPAMITTPGTNIEDGLRTAIEALPSGSNRHGAVLLISDGEQLDGDGRRAAESASALGVPVFVIGVGTTEGSTIQIPNGDLIRDSDGEPVVSRLDEGSLSRLAGIGRGYYVSLSEADAIAEIQSELAAFDAGDGEYRTRARLRYSLFAALSLFFVFVHLAVRIIRWRDMF